MFDTWHLIVRKWRHKFTNRCCDVNVSWYISVEKCIISLLNFWLEKQEIYKWLKCSHYKRKFYVNLKKNTFKFFQIHKCTIFHPNLFPDLVVLQSFFRIFIHWLITLSQQVRWTLTVNQSLVMQTFILILI